MQKPVEHWKLSANLEALPDEDGTLSSRLWHTHWVNNILYVVVPLMERIDESVNQDLEA